MNKKDKKIANAAKSDLEGMVSKLEELGSSLRTLADDEQTKFANMTEGLQAGERGQAIEAAANALADAADACDNGNAREALDALGNLELD